MIKFRAMKKIFIFLIGALIFVGCEKEYSGIVTTSEQSFQVVELGVVHDVIYNPAEPQINLSIKFSSSNSIVTVYGNIIGSDDKKINSSPIIFYDDGNSLNGDKVKGDNNFSAIYSLPTNLVNGNYHIEYLVAHTSGSTIKVATRSFNFDNGASNVAPIVAHLVVPDTVRITTDTTYILITLAASDSNGYNDLDKVFFNSFIPPNGNASSSNPILLFDNGTNGDVTSGDGIFSRIVILPPVGVTRGIYRWEFQAKDRGRKTSNVIIHYLHVL